MLKKDIENHSVSVILVSFYTGDVLWRSIESVLKCNGLHELIIVDNGNPDTITEEIDILSQNDQRITLITGHGNIGFAAANNLGASHATGDYIVFLNPDCIIPEYTFRDGINALSLDSKNLVVGARITNLDGSEQAGSRRNLLTPTVAIVEGLGLHNILPKSMVPRINFHNNSYTKKITEVPAISGAFMMMRKTIFDKIGGMDEGYFLHVEDLDFCFQVNKLGGKIVHLSDLNVIHYRSTSQVANHFIEWNKTKGFIRYFQKNFAANSFIGFSPLMSSAIFIRFVIRVTLDFIRGLNPISLLIRNISSNKSEIDKRRVNLLNNHTIFKSIRTQKRNTNINNLIIAGATGQVGGAIMRRALAEECKITAFFNKTIINFSDEKVEWVYANLAGKEHINLSERVMPKALIHTPSLWYLPDHLEEFAASGVKRLICFSSTSIEGKANSSNNYEKKLVANFKNAEELVKEKCDRLGIKWTILRPTLIYGIGLDRNVSSIVRFIKSFGFFPVAGKAQGLRQPVHVDDLAKACISILDNPNTYGKCYNLSGGEVLTYHEMVGRIFDTIHRKRSILRLSYLPQLIDLYSKITRKEETNGEIARRMNTDLNFDHDLATENFGYNPRSFLSSGIEDIFPDVSEELHDASKPFIYETKEVKKVSKNERTKELINH